MSTEHERLLGAYADGELDPAAARRAEHLVAESPQAAAEVAHVRQLRALAKRALVSEPLPAELAARIARRLPAATARRSSSWALRTAVGAAAALLLVLMLPRFWRSPAPDLVAGTGEYVSTPAEFARVHRACALELRDDPHAVRGSRAGVAARRVGAFIAHPFYMPDLEPLGYTLDGLCFCGPDRTMRCVQAHYLAGPLVGGSAAGGAISIFSLDRPVMFAGVDAATVAIPGGDATVVDGVTVLRWNTKYGGFVLCTNLAPDEAGKLLVSVESEPPVNRDRIRGLSGDLRR